MKAGPTEMKGVARLNIMHESTARAEFTRCCGSSRWVHEMIQRRPFIDVDALFIAAHEVSRNLSADDWKEAFSHHPRIGDIKSLRDKFPSTWAWAEGEQAGAGNASEQVLQALAAGNAAYEKKFGFLFIVCATGRSADEMLTVLNKRLFHTPEEELAIAAEEQRKITHLRLEKLANQA